MALDRSGARTLEACTGNISTRGQGSRESANSVPLMIRLAEEGERPTILQYLVELPGYAITGDRLLRPDNSVAAYYENLGSKERWVSQPTPEEIVGYTSYTSRSK